MTFADAVEKSSLEANKPVDTSYFIGFAFFLCVMLFLTATFLAIKEYYYDSDALPVDTVSIKGNLNEQEISKISSILSNSGLLHNFIKLDVNSIQEVVESISWVDTVSVRKQWPAYLYLDIVEKKPVARWKEDRLFSDKSGIFDIPEGGYFGNLVVLDGPENKVSYMYRNYQIFMEILAAVGCGIDKVVLTNRQSWELFLDNGVKLILGRENIDIDELEGHEVVKKRLEKFAKVYPQIRKNFVKISYIDLRYDNGMAIGWKKEQDL